MYMKRDPENLAEAIKEVEKLQAAQQITSTLLPHFIGQYHVQ